MPHGNKNIESRRKQFIIREQTSYILTVVSTPLRHRSIHSKNEKKREKARKSEKKREKARKRRDRERGRKK